MGSEELPRDDALPCRRLAEAYRELANEWHPQRVGCATTVLFIAESPPDADPAVVDKYLKTGEVKMIPYFYNAQETWSCRRLAYAISTLFQMTDKDAWKFGDAKRLFLGRFQKSGFLLRDLYELPLGIQDGAEDFRDSPSRLKRFQEVADSSPHEDMIVLLKRLDDWVPSKIRQDTKHFRIVTFPTRFGPQSLCDALSELHYHLDPRTGLFRKNREGTIEKEAERV